jgi:antitoxin ParD1/3/4
MQAEKLSVSLPADIALMIRQRVDSGQYASGSAVVREALRLWMERELDKERRLEEIRAKLDAAIEDPRSLTPEEVRQMLQEAHQRAMKAKDVAT